jgi:hypothetical protein
MPLFSRSEGILLTRLPGWRKMFPFLMRTRTESFIIHSQAMRVKKALALIEKLNEGRTDSRYGIFHIVLAAAVRLFALRPENNRFVAGRRIYQRKQIVLSFVTKKELTDHSAETNVKITFEPTDTLEQVAHRVWDSVQAAKTTEVSPDERATSILTRLPRCLVSSLLWGWKVLDYFNLLPASAIAGDALYCSAYFANLGSIGLDAVIHHLFEWGTCPFFVTVGKTKKALFVTDEGQQSIEDVITMGFNFDERTSDGVNYSKTIRILNDCIENPEQLFTPPRPEDLPNPFALA